MSQIIDRLTQELESRTQAALVGLDDLDWQVTQAIDHAASQAQERINLRLEGILGAVELSLSTLTARVTEMAAEALETAVRGIGERLDAISPTRTPEPASEPASPVLEAVPEPQPEPEYGTQEWLDHQNRLLDEQAARDREQASLPAPETITTPQDWSIIEEPGEDDAEEKEEEADPEVESASHEPANRVEQYLEPSTNGRHPRKKTRKGGK